MIVSNIYLAIGLGTAFFALGILCIVVAIDVVKSWREK